MPGGGTWDRGNGPRESVIHGPGRQKGTRWGLLQWVRGTGRGGLGPNAKAVRDTIPLLELNHSPAAPAVAPCTYVPRVVPGLFQRGAAVLRVGGGGGRESAAHQAKLLLEMHLTPEPVGPNSSTCQPAGPGWELFPFPQSTSWPRSCCGRAAWAWQGSAVPGFGSSA